MSQENRNTFYNSQSLVLPTLKMPFQPQALAKLLLVTWCLLELDHGTLRWPISTLRNHGSCPHLGRAAHALSYTFFTTHQHLKWKKLEDPTVGKFASFQQCLLQPASLSTINCDSAFSVISHRY